MLCYSHLNKMAFMLNYLANNKNWVKAYTLEENYHQGQICFCSTQSRISHVCRSLVDFSVQVFSFVSHFQRHLACL